MRKIQTLRVNNSRIFTIKDAKLSGYCFFMNLNIWGDFQICISVPLRLSFAKNNEKWKIIVINTVWNVSKYGVFSGPYFPVFGLNTDQKKQWNRHTFKLIGRNISYNMTITPLQTQTKYFSSEKIEKSN